MEQQIEVYIADWAVIDENKSSIELLDYTIKRVMFAEVCS